jgi:hypothetical protein
MANIRKRCFQPITQHVFKGHFDISSQLIHIMDAIFATLYETQCDTI